MKIAVPTGIRRLVVVLVTVTKYDREGYPIQFRKGVLPCNSLAAMWSLTQAAFASPELAGLNCQVIAFDEKVMKGLVNPRQVMAEYNAPDTRVVVGLVGVQSNMFPRAHDLAREFRALGASVVMGGFHVSGAITMLHDGENPKIPCPHVMPPECAELMAEGITIFHGEAEGSWHQVLADIVHGEAKPLYRGGRPPLTDAPLPEYPPGYFDGFFQSFHTMDTGRGCPFTCSFCTIINVQGHDPRYRSVEAIVARVRRMCAEEKKPFFFFTDDNFPRNPYWKDILTGLAKLREQDRLDFNFMIEADLASWKLKEFLPLLSRAGCTQVFMGVETVRQESLNATRKPQNRVATYAEMCEAYHRLGIACHAGYIIGFPEDTPESIKEDVATLKDIGFDQASFFILTPIPGSEDHTRFFVAGVRMDEDLNDYDSFQPVMDHPRMSRQELQEAYNLAWREFFTAEQMVAALMRVGAKGYWSLFRNFLWYRWSALAEDVHPMLAGFYRYRHFRSRRLSAPRISYARHLWTEVGRRWRYLRMSVREYYLFQQVYFASRYVTVVPVEGTSWEERLLHHRAAVHAYATEWDSRIRRSRWFGKTFGRAAHREWLNAFWRRYAGLEWRLLIPHKWGWHLKALFCVVSEFVYAIRFNTALMFLTLRRSL